MHKKILKTLEFDQIRADLQKQAVTEKGQAMASRLEPRAHADKVQQMLDETYDGAKLLRLKGGIPVPALPDISASLKRVRIGAALNGTELAGISRVLQTVDGLVAFFDDIEELIELRRLYDLRGELSDLPALSRRLQRAIDDDGTVRDEASPELANLRRTIKTTEGQIREKMDGYTRGNSAKYLSDPIVTIRDGRYVIPVRSENKNKFGGVVHDQSASGQTLFIEPESIVNLNNKLREAQLAEQQEVNRILAVLSAEIEPEIDSLFDNARVIAYFDFINAKAKYARAIKATEPVVDDKNVVDLIQARHPLIDPAKVVANDIKLGGDYQAIVITGPNTGGKTITLKTLGLIQIMAQAGLYIPANEGSHIAVFSNVFADIGDEQSIEQNLSTFSAHMSNIISILNDLDSNALVLFDELGAGTDPQEGAALAISILDAVGEIGADVVATTHYPELKLYGYNTPGTINASMAFDIDTLQPTYHLLIGVPGRSNAFEIAQRLGLDQPIVDRAKLLISSDSHQLNDMISDLEKERQAAAMTDSDLQKELDRTTSLHNDLKKAYDELNAQKDKELKDARSKANAIVMNAQRESDSIIKELRQLQKQAPRMIKDDKLISAKTKLNSLHEADPLTKNKVLKRAKKQAALKVGDSVKVLQYGQTGTIVKKLDNKQWQVQVGIMKMAVNDNGLEKIQPERDETPKRHVATVKGGMGGPGTTLDLRGQRYNEAMANLDSYIDAALLANYPTVTIVHGLGTGAIRNGVTEYLKRSRNVKKFGYAPANAGGSGATIVVFK
ncbi:endonuclease MutS2 [Lacticaseibacillus pabuli]|uniref:Endonuclease MutS2 n=1 Tax=Lacticaseibacillus pabuli TaxID=3025672 RepID=A0ABY7WTA7_9LACO|nr:endonuclease MutS2 [Lacticaseibacillus sp. KACC 23028]WDF83398.1 endonuclease MutS2 [Lacticaseibacillus sp. KACC 23028]